MNVIPFDTLAASKALEESGFPRAQAEALARMQRDALREFTTVKRFC